MSFRLSISHLNAAAEDLTDGLLEKLSNRCIQVNYEHMFLSKMFIIVGIILVFAARTQFVYFGPLAVRWEGTALDQ